MLWRMVHANHESSWFIRTAAVWETRPLRHSGIAHTALPMALSSELWAAGVLFYALNVMCCSHWQYWCSMQCAYSWYWPCQLMLLQRAHVYSSVQLAMLTAQVWGDSQVSLLWSAYYAENTTLWSKPVITANIGKLRFTFTTLLCPPLLWLPNWLQSGLWLNTGVLLCCIFAIYTG
jgi:hypothetical protein